MILFASKYGAVAEYVAAVQAASDGRIAAYDMVQDPAAASRALAEHTEQRVLVIAAIYAGRVPAKVTRFLDAHRAVLERYQLSCAVSCLYPSPRAEEQLAQGFPHWLWARSKLRFTIGGRVRMAALSAPVRLLLRFAAGLKTDMDTLRLDNAAEVAAWLRGSD